MKVVVFLEVTLEYLNGQTCVIAKIRSYSSLCFLEKKKEKKPITYLLVN